MKERTVLPRLPNFESARILVVGDVMLDQAWIGRADRISPEAPVPVVSIHTLDERPGGAANVALNILRLGAQVTLMGVVGQDVAADTLSRDLSAQGIKVQFLRTAAKTIRKLRILSHHHQMIRLDHEASLAILDEAERDQFLAWFELAMPEHDLVILSDYAKGTLAGLHQILIQKARGQGVPVLVDPKVADVTCYRKASVLTPNLKEFETWVGVCSDLDDLEKKAQILFSEQELDALVITRSEHGMSLITKDEICHIPAKNREVFDVTGAGDTVIAVMGLSLALKLSLKEAVNLANIAAGVVVGKSGTAQVSPEELHRAVQAEALAAAGPCAEYPPFGISDRETLKKVYTVAQARGEKIVFTNGCFDLLHAEHVLSLNEAKALGDRLIVGVNTDESIKRLKGVDRPIIDLADRMAMLAAMKSVDWVVPFSEDTPEALIEAVQPDVLFKGSGYRDIETQNLPGARLVLNRGGQVLVSARKPKNSSTQIIQKLKEIEGKSRLHANATIESDHAAIEQRIFDDICH